MERIQNHRFPNGRKNLNKKTNSTARNEVSGTNNGRGRWRSRNKSKLVVDDDNSLSISFLHNLTENNSSNSILKFLTKNKEKYTNIFNDSMDKKSLSVITNLNAELCQSTFISDKYNILRITMNKQFLDSWNGIISTVSLERTNVLEWRKLEKDVLNIFTIFEHSLDLFPSLCWYMIKDMLILIKVNNEIINGNSLSGSNNFKEKILYLTEQVTYFENRFSSTKKRTKTTMNKQLEPDDDFRSMDIFPSTKELVTPERNFVRKNIINGSYDNIPHYLDVLFRLQREDFLNPIREDICDYIRNVERRFFNIKVFENVTFFGETINKDDICFTVNLNMDKNTQARVKSNQNKRFMTGCLLVFTDDNFQTTFCGLVKKSDAASRGELTVSFEGTFPKLRHNYIMVECIVFFDPYYHVLKVLQTLPHDQLSMSKYIIDVETSITKPSYIPSYNSNVEANLNDSQIKAMKGALTQEFVVIQGPPGTGKTYLGLKITQRLLQYKAGPILVVCYTNHALDQFLEGLLPFTNKLVRFGSQTKSKVLQEKHTLRAMRREQRISVMVKDQRESIESYAKQIKNIDREIKRLREPNGIIDFNFVKENVSFLRDSCFSSFTEEDFFAWILQDTSKLDDTNYLKFIYRNYFSALKGKRDYFLAPTHMPQCLTYLKIGMSFVEDDILNLKAAYENGEVFQDVYLEWKRYYEDGLVTIQKDFKIFTEKLQFLKKQMNNRYEDPPSQKLITDPFILSSDQRWQLYNFWLKCLEDALQMVKRNEIALYREAYAEFDMLMEDANVATMKKMEILGMTTSCAARMHTTLQRVECPIVVVEEAAEVVESHIIATLTKHCQHLILLGDHQQLKPSTSDYVMEKQFNLGVSLFERMVKNNIQCHTLNVQHRMRPEISRLISPVIYPDLKDAVTVSKYPQVKGVTRSVYFIDHNHEETLYGDSSKFNKFEAEFLIKLANYFLKIGYTPEDITILAAYAGQVATIKKEVPKIKTKDLENVLVTCVDNFQGEESKIILLSLVRNNARGNVGFTSIENRICVALSRAKEGLYIMGNMRQLCNASSVWVEINKTLKEDNSIGDKLPLVCEIHKTVTNIKELEDFDDVPEGGCDLQCDAMLSCGHECRKKCHVQDLSHEKYKCYEKCLKQICANPLHDLCNMYCYEDCGQCCYLVSVNLPCGHDENVPCYKENKLNEVTCTFKQTIHLRCGHMVEQLCSMKADKIKCDEYCNEVLTCGHKCVQKCHYDKDPHHENYNCEELCDKENLKCSKHINKHVSTVPCSKNPNICTEKVMKFRKECSHAYANVECHKDIDDMECTKPCKKLLECTHPCLNKCGEKCGPCKKDVSVEAECGHWINVACGKVVKNINCNKQCKKVLKCGHTCPNNCGEMCSRKCKSTCNKQLECGHYCIATCGQPCACEIKRIPECLHKVLLKCDQEPLKKWCKECTSNIDRLQSSFSDLTILDDDYYDCD